eukprot:CAMPEP_0195103042 /NCGR_PEP_ID=MMETSP0448-20130528/70702_1 /TAXON_ID=66468 /ORGANISM="Heterocapsa triquestra, Strain CCMP 448" /LENGTH=80 /DNA_ID=CAMNT_0040138637 /DNA_START=254 /DNA_END=496 /DNA_ORIENTATION=+
MVVCVAPSSSLVADDDVVGVCIVVVVAPASSRACVDVVCVAAVGEHPDALAQPLPVLLQHQAFFAMDQPCTQLAKPASQS